MGLRIATNIQSMKAKNSLQSIEMEKSKTMEKLSSGNKINKAADDAAGLAISEKLKSAIKSGEQALRNTGDGISMIQTAEGGMNEISSILLRLRELSVQSASDSLGDDDRNYSNLEFQNLSNEISRISNSTEFNGKKLLTGSLGKLDFQIGICNKENQDRIIFDTAKIISTSEEIGINNLNVSTKDNAQKNLSKIDVAIEKINSNRALVGSLQNRMNSVMNNLETSNQNSAESNSRIRDTDMGSETANLTRQNILSSSATAVLSQSNNLGAGALRLIG